MGCRKPLREKVVDQFDLVEHGILVLRVEGGAGGSVISALGGGDLSKLAMLSGCRFMM